MGKHSNNEIDDMGELYNGRKDYLSRHWSLSVYKEDDGEDLELSVFGVDFSELLFQGHFFLLSHEPS